MKMQDEECKSVPLCTLFEGHEATHGQVTFELNEMDQFTPNC
jgi:hypothetical protein